ncbi:hypothetical protein [Rickettsia oklahomensis]|uniref:Uncharacterized protein n=1 Tax=Rickettsia oklahomensis TaxID=3141789 RepID=A0AAU7BY21_9RICK
MLGFFEEFFQDLPINALDVQDIYLDRSSRYNNISLRFSLAR